MNYAALPNPTTLPNPITICPDGVLHSVATRTSACQGPATHGVYAQSELQRGASI